MDNAEVKVGRHSGGVINIENPAAGFDGLLFDMDGTVLSSIAASERVWTQWARRHGLNVDTFVPTVHGVRAIDTVRNSGVEGIDVAAEAAAILEAEVADIDGIEPIAGASEFLASVPRDRWAIVTSAPRRLAQRRIAAAGLPEPSVLITGDDVARGKPMPDAFNLGAERLGCKTTDCLAFEDAPAGIQSAEAAGASVVIVSSVHSSNCESEHPVITDYRQLQVQVLDTGRVYVTLT